MSVSVTQAFGQEIAAAVLAELLPYIDKKIEEIVAKRSAPAGGKITLSIKDICEMTGLSVSTIERRINNGEFPSPINHEYMGGKRFWARRDIEKYLGI